MEVLVARKKDGKLEIADRDALKKRGRVKSRELDQIVERGR